MIFDTSLAAQSNACGIAYTNIEELLEESFSCQHCGQQIRWDLIRKHELEHCSSSSRTFSLPEFDIVPDKVVQTPNALAHPEAEPPEDAASPRASSPSAIGATANIRSIFDKYREAEKWIQKPPQSSPIQSSPSLRCNSSPATVEPPGRCVYCHLPFGKNKLAHRILHQRVCTENPSFKIHCVFCSLEFKSTLDRLAIEQVAVHEEVCKENPMTQCEYCGNKYGAPMGVNPDFVASQLQHHQLICSLNPLNYARCPHCSRQFQSTDRRPAYLMCSYHANNCELNPRNSCRFCGLRFCGVAEPNAQDAAVAKRRNHEATCPIRPPKQPRPNPPARELHSRGSTINKKLSAERVILTLQRELKNLPPERLRGRLRQLQLAWHPDKHVASEADTGAALVVFRFIQTTTMIEIIINDRLGKKAKVKCDPDDFVGDLKKQAAVQLGTRPEKLKFQKQHVVLKDHIRLSDYEIKDGMNIELFYN